MDKSLIETLAREIAGTFRHHRLERAGTADIQRITLDEAYAVQEKFLAERLAAGERAGRILCAADGRIRESKGPWRDSPG